MSAPAGLLDNASHLRRELALLEQRLRREILATRSTAGTSAPRDEFSGLFIPDEEIDGYLAEAEGEARPELPPEIAELDSAVAETARSLAADGRAALQVGQNLRLLRLREAFDLSASEYSAFIACLAPELDLRFERYFAYLQNDLNRRRPCAQLLGRLFAFAGDGYPVTRALVAAPDSLVGLTLLEGTGSEEGALAGRELRVTPGVRDFVLAIDETARELRRVGRWRAGEVLPSAASYYAHHQRLALGLSGQAAREGYPPRAHLYGPEGVGKEALVLDVAQALQAPVFECSAAALLGLEGDFQDWLRALDRELRLRGAFLWIRHVEDLLERTGEGRECMRALGTFLMGRPRLGLLITGIRRAPELSSRLGISLSESELPAPDLSERVELWRVALGRAPEETAALCETLAAKFRFTPGKIQRAVERLEREQVPSSDELWDAAHRVCRRESSPVLERCAPLQALVYAWEDLVLPKEVLDQLRQICDAVRYRTRVAAEWGFERKFSLGKGLSVLFSGASGTGKTMSAEVVAREVGLDLYKVDLSHVVSKYIGETEKNLGQIFDEAETANCILLFDEADALFGKRSEVKDSHDRYANIEINFLLQRLEEYHGIVILTTNMSKNLDAAFTRRLQFTVEFPAPEARQRERLWSKVFPEATPRARDLDLEFLAKRFNLSGASIKNVALSSAFLAASNGGVVDMRHVLTALRRECKKLGRLTSRSDFGAYSHLVHDDSDPSES